MVIKVLRRTMKVKRADILVFVMHNSGACDKDAPDPVEAVLSGCEAEQEGQVHQGREETLHA